MKIKVLFIILSLFINCCTAKPGSSIPLFNDITFTLHNHEKIAEIDSGVKEIFNSYFDHKSIQIPLFRYIRSDSSQIFIGIPFRTSIKDLLEYNLSATYIQTYSEGDSTTSFYKKYKSDSEYIEIYARDFDNNLVYVLISTQSLTISDSLFSLQNIAQRFNR